MQIVRDLGGYTLGRSDLRAPCHVEEESGSHGKGAPELCIWK